MTSVPTNIIRSCAVCGVEFDVPSGNRGQLNCSKRCGGTYRRKPSDPEESPPEWDGITRFNDEPLRTGYRLVCSQCSHERYLRLSKAEMRCMQPQQCPRCGMRMWLEDVPTTTVVPSRYHSRVSQVA